MYTVYVCVWVCVDMQELFMCRCDHMSTHLTVMSQKQNESQMLQEAELWYTSSYSNKIISLGQLYKSR